MVKLVNIDNNQSFSIQSELFYVGRADENNIVIDKPYISRKHIKILNSRNHFFIEDQGTINGTYLNNILINRPAPLKNGDIISLTVKGPRFRFIIEKGRYHFNEFIKVSWKSISPYIFLMSVIFVFSLLLLFLILINNPGMYTEAFYENNFRTSRSWREKFLELMEKYGETDYSDNPEIFQKIESYIKYYSKSSAFQWGMEKRMIYINTIEDIFQSQKIPVDLTYIAFVESFYNTRAYNKYSGARGMWQLMPMTARQYGLQVNNSVDERIDLDKSTLAAAKYLGDLISVFGIESILICIAAYNAGDGALRYALSHLENPIEDRHFWYLYQHDLIPHETKEYVLKVIALILLSENREELAVY